MTTTPRRSRRLRHAPAAGSTTRPGAPRRRRAGGERGAAMVEFALVGLLFVLLLSGLITFGLILSFKQNLTQAAAEGARAGAVATQNPAAAALTATNAAVEAYDEQCGSGALSCPIVVDDCDGNPATLQQCITVTIEYDYAADPLIPPFPILSSIYPDELVSSSTAEVNP